MMRLPQPRQNGACVERANRPGHTSTRIAEACRDIALRHRIRGMPHQD